MKIIKDPATKEADQPRYFRAFDFLTGPEKEAALKEPPGVKKVRRASSLPQKQCFRLRPFLRLLLVVAAILPAMLHADDPAQRAKDAIVVRALLRLPGIDLSNKPEQKAALLRHLETLKGSEPYLEHR